MSNENQEDIESYQVIVNAEGQYSLWRAQKKIPDGWKSADKTGTKAECLLYVDEVWTDMRPVSLSRSSIL